MNHDESILVLTTRENSWWLSMQEVIPAIDRVWAGLGQSSPESVRMFRVPLAPEVEQQLRTSAARLKRIVVTVAMPGTVAIALLLRLHMNVAAPMIIYIYGDATDGFHFFGPLANVLTEADTLVVSCESEAVAVRHCFPRAQVSVIPIPLVDQFKLNDTARDTTHKTARLAYVGRVSEQKNLHTLLFALWILRTLHGCGPGITLDVYGGEDNLGSPNIGLTYRNYFAYLQGLTELLGLADMVTWHGFKPRGWLFDNVHLAHHILVSPTLHSDENFGSSVLASLVNGHQVVTTAWGGHFGFQERFSEQLTLVPVHRSTMGPVVDPVLLANAILRAINRMSTANVAEATLGQARAAFSEHAAISHVLEMLNKPVGQPVPLEKSPTQRRIEERRASFGGTRKIYADYADPLANIFFEAYGMKEPLAFQERASYVVAPWATYSGNVLRVDDPHRGQQSFSAGARIAKPMDVTLCPSMDVCRLPESLVRTLVIQGYAFALPSAGEVVAGA